MNYKLFHNINLGICLRLIMIKGNPYFIGRDVAIYLRYKNPNDALKRHVDLEDKDIVNHDTPGGSQKLVVINESGLYSLIFRSKLDAAKIFKRWVTSEVLPAIRKEGGYIKPVEGESDLELMSRALLIAEATIAAKDKECKAAESLIKENEPKVAVYSKLLDQEGVMSMNIAAKHLNIGPNALFQTLRDLKVLMISEENYNIPYQKYINRGLFKVKKRTHKYGSKGEKRIVRTTMVTEKGLLWLAHNLDLIMEAKAVRIAIKEAKKVYEQTLKD